MEEAKQIWIFNGDKNSFPSAVFDSKKLALDWIKTYKLSGTLTLYPVNISVYNWAIDNNYYTPKQEFQKTPTNIANFTSTHLEHIHFVEGVEDK